MIVLICDDHELAESSLYCRAISCFIVNCAQTCYCGHKYGVSSMYDEVIRPYHRCIIHTYQAHLCRKSILQWQSSATLMVSYSGLSNDVSGPEKSLGRD